MRRRWTDNPGRLSVDEGVVAQLLGSENPGLGAYEDVFRQDFGPVQLAKRHFMEEFSNGLNVRDFTISITAVPEPGALGILGLGGMVMMRRRARLRVG